MGHLLPYAPNYDGAGNLQVVNGYSGTVYNAENQWIQQTHFGITYVYDGLGRRVEATGGSSGTRVYWYDESGNVLSESDQNGVFQNDYIYFNGQKITWVDLGHGQPTTNNYYLTDHLGNNRMIITQVGTVCYDADFYPWGAEQYVKTNTCPVQNYKFTGKERDTDMGEDDFGARFYKDDMSRFFSPDWSSGPEPVPYAKLDHPQSLNLYTYVHNNPTTFRDPDGHEVDPGGEGEASGPNGGDPTGDTQESTTVDKNGRVHTETTITVRANTHWWNRLGSWLSDRFSFVSVVFSRSLGTSGGPRAGKPFTPKGRQTVINRNAAENGGTNICENCKQPTIPAKQSQSGVTPPGNETNVDHIHPSSLGGDGDPANGEVLCKTCNGVKSNSLPVVRDPVEVEPIEMPEIPLEIPF